MGNGDSNRDLMQLVREVGELVGQTKALAPILTELRSELTEHRQNSAREMGEQAARLTDISARLDSMHEELNGRLKALNTKVEKKVDADSVPTTEQYVLLKQDVDNLKKRKQQKIEWKAELVRGLILVAIAGILGFLTKWWL